MSNLPIRLHKIFLLLQRIQPIQDEIDISWWGPYLCLFSVLKLSLNPLIASDHPFLTRSDKNRRANFRMLKRYPYFLPRTGQWCPSHFTLYEGVLYSRLFISSVIATAYRGKLDPVKWNLKRQP